MDGRGRRVAELLVWGALLAAGCTGGGHQGSGPPAATAAPPGRPPATRSAAYGIPCLQGRERAAAFRFDVGQGFETVGVVLGGGSRGLVFGHQRGGDLCEWLSTARSYARLGYRVLVFDFHDQDQVDDDVVAAVAELRRRGAPRVVLVGSSMGGTAVLVAAARIRPAVSGVVSLSGPAVFGDIDARSAVVRLRVPVLLMAARLDRPFASAALGLYGAAATRDKRLLVLGSDAHGSAMLTFGQEAARARAAVRGFVTAHLGR
jgi:pimeloyl-ACP methyl ester carboxylesterase